MSLILSFPGTAALTSTFLATARALPAGLPPPMALQPPAAQRGTAIRLHPATPLRTALARATLGKVKGLTPEDPSWPVDGFAWTEATGLPLPGTVTTHDLLSIGTVHFPEGPVPVPGAWGSTVPTPLDDGETGVSPLRLHAALRLAAACGDREGLDLLLQPVSASVLVVPEDLIAPVAWVLTHVARITREVRETGHPGAPLRLLVLRGGAGDAAALRQALAERTRLVILTPGPLPAWPEGVAPPDWLGLPPTDAALIGRQIAATWPGEAWGDDDPGWSEPDLEDVVDEDWLIERTLPPEADLATLTAADIRVAFAAPDPAAVLHALNRCVFRD